MVLVSVFAITEDPVQNLQGVGKFILLLRPLHNFFTPEYERQKTILNFLYQATRVFKEPNFPFFSHDPLLTSWNYIPLLFLPNTSCRISPSPQKVLHL